MDIVKVKSVEKVYKSSKVKAVNGINLTVQKGEFVSIIGDSGSGKTTLLNMIGGLDKPTYGEIVVNDININKLSEDDLCKFRRKNIGFIFQSYNLLPILNVYENIILPLRADDVPVNKEYVEEIMKNLNIYNKRKSMPNELSGGQQQRVAIARALVTNPAVILADEPTGNLDSKNSDEVLILLKRCSKKYKQTILLITHNEKIAMNTDRVIRIQDGMVVNE